MKYIPKMCRANVSKVHITRKMEFDVDAIEHALQINLIKMLMFSNPSNPVGCMLDKDGFECIIASVSLDYILIVDESYYKCAMSESKYPDGLFVWKR